MLQFYLLNNVVASNESWLKSVRIIIKTCFITEDEEVVMEYFKIIFQHLHGETEEKYIKSEYSPPGFK
jgi:hypothetical protein